MYLARPFSGVLALGSILITAVGAWTLLATSVAVAAHNICDRPPPNEQRFSDWLKGRCYKGWPHDPRIRSTGPTIGGVNNSVHGRVRVYYSPDMVDWMMAGRPGGEPPPNAILIKEQYPNAGNKLQGWTAMLRDARASQDGWLWFQEFFGSGVQAEFGFTGCLRCHASAASGTTYASLRNLEGRSFTYPSPGEIQWYPGHVSLIDDDPAEKRLLPRKRVQPDPRFLAQFHGQPSVPTSQLISIPNHNFDHVFSGPKRPQQFLTSDQCVGCHNAYDLPNMQLTDRRGRVLNLSPYGEWSASLMGLAGRDPVFHAQLEAETDTYRPGILGFTENFCYSCHGAMGERQINIDSKGPFRHDMVYALPGDKNAMFGALARDGVSCTVCHHIAPDGLGTKDTFAGNFNLGPPDELYGPFDDPKTYPMEQALGIRPKLANQLTSSALCGSCHTVIIPKIPTGYAGNPDTDPSIEYEYEQTTFLEWRNSAYQNEVAPINPRIAQTCQDCHMPHTYGDQRLRFKIANIEEPDYPDTDNRAPDDLIQLSPRAPYGRHTLVGINLFVMEMFQQFRGILGIAAPDDASDQMQTATDLLTATQSSFELAQRGTATLQVVSARIAGGALEIAVRVHNHAGHKFPSGVGFRRAWLEFSVVDAGGQVLWASGRPNALGVITGSDGEPLSTEFARTEWQPHWQVISREDQVQIYEERTLDDQHQLTTSFLARFNTVKDNRLLPAGWDNTAPNTGFMQPEQVSGDPQYFNGSGNDEVTYRVPLAAIPEAVRVRVALHYQSIPPYYLRDRFETLGSETARLYHIASRLHTAGTPIEGWTLKVAEAAVSLR